jgi:hypothetical protein
MVAYLYLRSALQWLQHDLQSVQHDLQWLHRHITKALVFIEDFSPLNSTKEPTKGNYEYLSWNA